MEISEIITNIQNGFSELSIDNKYKSEALKNIELWLKDEIYKDYIPQIEYLVETKKWDLLLDSFYQVIPFGTGGRRGFVGIGPNRINTITIQLSAQGHSQYLIKKYGEDAKTRGIVISYDVRKFIKKGIFDDQRQNPVKDLSCKDLAEKAAVVYAGNGIKVYMFDTFSSTPELSFQVRRKNCVGGDMISASHNPPEYNGKKVVDEHGGQLTPPQDEELVDVVTKEVETIKTIPFDEAKQQGLIEFLTQQDHIAYIEAASQTSISNYRDIKILFSPFHGTASTSVYPVLKRLGFHVNMDKNSSIPDPSFSSIVFNIPNPEVIEAYTNLIPEADNINADIIMVADPDADRIGLMSKESNIWRFYNGNEIFVLATSYLLEEYKKQNKLNPEKLILKTLVTTNFIQVLAEKFGIKIKGDLLVGFKYIGNIMNEMESKGELDNLLIAGEESHGSVVGGYIRDKDTCVPAILVAELASRLKKEGLTLGQYLDNLYEENGFYQNYLTEIRLPGAEGMSKMNLIQEAIRNNPPDFFGNFEIETISDYWKGEPFKSETDKVSRNVLKITFKPIDKIKYMHVVIRPSGTEPKTKFYFEIGLNPNSDTKLDDEKSLVAGVLQELEKAVIKYCYKVIGIDFPDRGFLLFWQLDAVNKMLYFKIEPQIEEIKKIEDKQLRKEKLNELLSFLGSDPIRKVDKAFKAKYGVGIESFLEL